MTTGVFVVARLSSSRLPGKAMLDLLGKPMIERLIERVGRARSIDTVAIATSDEISDDPLADFARDRGIACHRGSLPNIMERVAGAADAFGCDTVVEVLGDNPLVHSDLIDDVVSLYRSGSYDYCASITREYRGHAEGRRLFALGIRVQVYSAAAAARYSDYPGYLEADGKSSTAYIYEHPQTFKLRFVEARDRWASLNRPDVNFAVNYRKNFDMVSRIFAQLYPRDANFGLQDVIRLYDEDGALPPLMGA
jgi:spore coat polysaccharide biosynthesis protein SpsF